MLLCRNMKGSFILSKLTWINFPLLTKYMYNSKLFTPKTAQADHKFYWKNKSAFFILSLIEMNLQLDNVCETCLCKFLSRYQKFSIISKRKPKDAPQSKICFLKVLVNYKAASFYWSTKSKIDCRLPVNGCNSACVNEGIIIQVQGSCHQKIFAQLLSYNFSCHLLDLKFLLFILLNHNIYMYMEVLIFYHTVSCSIYLMILPCINKIKINK